MMFPGPLPDLTLRTLSEYYIRPYYHAVCFFGGCMTYLIVDDFRESKISKRLQQVGWCGSVACGLFCVFVKFAWYTSPNPVPMGVALLAAFSDRILWTLFLSWITLTCCMGRGGVLSKLLSWNAYVPLSKLSFGVYLIHVPFLHLWFYSSRERRFWSVFNQVTLLFALLVWSFLLSYLAFLVCEAPTAALDKLVLTRLMGGGRNEETINNSRKVLPGNTRMNGSDVKKSRNSEDNVVYRC
ncbi:nose resistant to fluoxetine protein 6-like [Rhipicephalus microplus]|uniref:nose resistant to fluoxetine protein 6-like n=1 Tax=Rhipicephalus microplus TaxID=6941 RepID=UPI003F6D4F5F